MDNFKEWPIKTVAQDKILTLLELTVYFITLQRCLLLDMIPSKQKLICKSSPLKLVKFLKIRYGKIIHFHFLNFAFIELYAWSQISD